ncbi:MAG: tRNA (adenosine(37)-N6)-dimethylallyltransferase MiaA [Rhizobiaceae bacterium]|nr:tRNA (adenosine(37)-N6)-dimethylallyltransferase MiaA [Rhizobiaceae bacterium]
MAAYKTFLIAGPTASGKSALALWLAERSGGAVLNADSMQVYAGLPVLTAQPSVHEQARAPHRLYGHVAPSHSYSTGRWLADMRMAMAEAAGSPHIIVGGTGLYFTALTKGLAEMPPIDAGLRAELRAALDASGPQALHRKLAVIDPDMAARLGPSDGQRIIRALEVKLQTGMSIATFQRQATAGDVDMASPEVCAIVLDPPPARLAANIEQRFHVMMAQGASDEVRKLVEMRLDPALPAMKAIGVRELARLLGGDISESQAVELAVIATRQYAKRQRTWFRNQFGPQWRRFASADAAIDAIRDREL